MHLILLSKIEAKELNHNIQSLVGIGPGQEDKRVAQGEATQQPACTTRGREGGAMKGR